MGATMFRLTSKSIILTIGVALLATCAEASAENLGKRKRVSSAQPSGTSNRSNDAGAAGNPTVNPLLNNKDFPGCMEGTPPPPAKKRKLNPQEVKYLDEFGAQFGV